MRLATSVATTVLVTILVAAIAYSDVRMQLHPASAVLPPRTSATSSSVPPSPAMPSPRVAPAGALKIWDLDMVDRASGWALSGDCSLQSARKCAYFVASTANGGRSWSRPAQVGPLFESTNGDAPRRVHFIDTQNGFVWGGFGAYVTHNAGTTWSATTLQAVQFVAFAGRGELAWAVTYPCKKGGGLGPVCIYQVRSTKDGGSTWSAPYALPTTFSAPAAEAFGPRGLLVTGGPSAGMVLTSDGGASWRHIDPQCPAGTFREINATSDGVELLKVCIGQADQTFTTMLVSENNGRSWTGRNIRSVEQLSPAADNMPLIASPSDGVAVIASNKSTIAITHDSGNSWNQAGPSGIEFSTLRFGSATDGYAVDVHGNLWVTQDGGDRWSTLGTLSRTLR